MSILPIGCLRKRFHARSDTQLFAVFLVENPVEVTSPIVGTFYRSPGPDADPYVQVGDTVKSDTVLCIVEAMKLMNEIFAEETGVVREVCLGDAEPVEYGQPLFALRAT